MPTAARKLCRRCSRLAEPGKRECALHAGQDARERNRDRRTDPVKRLYDTARWRRRTVPYILARDPLCQLRIVCNGRAASTDVHHVVRAEVYVEQHPYDPGAFHDPANLLGACHACHSAQTAREEGRGGIIASTA